MSTRSSTRNLIPPLEDQERTIRRRNHGDPSLLINGDDANKHIDKFLHVTQSIKVNGVTDDALRIYLFPHSLTHHATAWFDRLLRNSITTFEQMAKMFLGKYFPPSMVVKLRNEITNFRQRLDESLFKAWEYYKLSIDYCPNHNMLPVTQKDTLYNRSESSSSITSSSDLKIVALKAEMVESNKNLMKVLQTNQQVKAITLSCETCGGPHLIVSIKPSMATFKTYMLQEPTIKVVILTNLKANDAVMKNMQTQMTSLTNFNIELKNMFGTFMKMNTASTSGSRQLPSNTIANPKGELKAITTQSGVSYEGSLILPPFSSLPKVVEWEPEVIKDTVKQSTKNIQPPVVQTQVLIDEPVVKPTIPYPSRVNKQKLHEKDDKLALKFVEIFKKLHFEHSFVDDLLHMPKFATMFKSILKNKEKLFDMATTPVNENCSVVILKKLPEKLGDPGKFLIRVIFRGILALRVDNEAITFKVGQTSKYSYNDAESINRIDVIDVACEEYAREVLGFSEISTSGNHASEPIISASSLTLNPFEDSDFLLEETDAFLAIKDDLISLEIDDSYYDSEGDILLLKEFLNDDPSPPLLPKELKFMEPKTEKSSIDEPPELELKDLPSYLDYAFLEGANKLPVIIAKNLNDDEKALFLKVLKSHKHAIA
nr:reverse transcriptase domain-containing protein [Tanacetum cinerariifolium]